MKRDWRAIGVGVTTRVIQEIGNERVDSRAKLDVLSRIGVCEVQLRAQVRSQVQLGNEGDDGRNGRVNERAKVDLGTQSAR